MNLADIVLPEAPGAEVPIIELHKWMRNRRRININQARNMREETALEEFYEQVQEFIGNGYTPIYKINA